MKFYFKQFFRSTFMQFLFYFGHGHNIKDTAKINVDIKFLSEKSI